MKKEPEGFENIEILSLEAHLISNFPVDIVLHWLLKSRFHNDSGENILTACKNMLKACVGQKL